MSENKECGGSEVEKLIDTNAEITDCAKQCEGVSSMFIFSTKQKRCFCETSATSQGSCTFEDMSDYHLYKYVYSGIFQIILTLHFINTSILRIFGESLISL